MSNTQLFSPIGYGPPGTMLPVDETLRLLLGGAVDDMGSALQIAGHISLAGRQAIVCDSPGQFGLGITTTSGAQGAQVSDGGSNTVNLVDSVSGFAINVTAGDVNLAGELALANGNDIRFNGPTDTNWRMGILNALNTYLIGASTALEIITGAGGGPDGFAIGNSNGDSLFEIEGSGGAAIFAGIVTAAANLSTNYLVDSSNTPSLNVFARQLLDSSAVAAIDWDTPGVVQIFPTLHIINNVTALVDTSVTTNPIVDVIDTHLGNRVQICQDTFDGGQALGTIGPCSFDNASLLFSGDGIIQSGGPTNAISIPNRLLFADDGTTPNLDWHIAGIVGIENDLQLGSTLLDSGGIGSLNATERWLIANDGGTVQLDWSTADLIFTNNQLFVGSSTDNGSGAQFQVSGAGDFLGGLGTINENYGFPILGLYTGAGQTSTGIEFFAYDALGGGFQAHSNSGWFPFVQRALSFEWDVAPSSGFLANVFNIASTGFVLVNTGGVDDGVNQLQINGPTRLVAFTSPTALACDTSGVIVQSATTATELGYVSGVTSAIQTQLNAKQASGSYITSLTTDVVASGAGAAAATIQAGAVTLAKMANLAANSIIGNNTGSAATPIALTVTQVNTLLGTLSNPMSAVGDTIYGGASGVAAKLVGNATATKKFLSETGTGSAATAPTWATLSASDLPQHIIGTGTAPTIAAGAGAGTSPTVAVTGHDSAGQISVASGTLPTGTNAVVVTVTFNSAYGTAPYVILYPANAATALLSGATMVYVVGSTGTFTINSGTTGITAATTYLWNYVVIG